LARTKDLDLSYLVVVGALGQRLCKLDVQLPLVDAMRNATVGKDVDSCQEVLAAVQKEGLDKHPEQWLLEISESSVDSFEELQGIVAGAGEPQPELALEHPKLAVDETAEDEHGISCAVREFWNL